MPTITIAATAAPTRWRRRVARGLADWLSARGVEAAHVITRFTVVDAEDAFSGPFPLGWAVAGQMGGTADYAFVTCAVSAHRDRAFRRDLAAQITQILQPEIRPDAIFVAVTPVDPEDHFRGGAPTQE